MGALEPTPIFFAMKAKRFCCLFAISIGGALLAALAHAASVGPDGGIKTLSEPAVLPIARFVGAVAGVVISPLVIWALNDKNLKIAVPTIYMLSISLIVALNVLQVGSAMYLGFVLTVVMLIIYRFIGKTVSPRTTTVK
jgi:hypothetical protein